MDIIIAIIFEVLIILIGVLSERFISQQTKSLKEVWRLHG